MSIQYNSNNVPQGGLFAEFFRGQGAPASLGTYLIESITPTVSVTLNKRPGVDGGENGWWMVDGDIEGSITVQRATDVTPTLQNGDFFTAAIRVNAAGEAISERFVLHGMSQEKAMGAYSKQSGSVIVDQHV
jgi:hypothetical protein